MDSTYSVDQQIPIDLTGTMKVPPVCCGILVFTSLVTVLVTRSKHQAHKTCSLGHYRQRLKVLCFTATRTVSQLVDPASVYMLLSKTKPCMLKTKAGVSSLRYVIGRGPQTAHY